MDTRSQMDGQGGEDLIARNAALSATNTSLRAQIAELNAHVDSLQQLLHATEQIVELRAAPPVIPSPEHPSPSAVCHLSYYTFLPSHCACCL